jgi:hypothetical protein
MIKILPPPTETEEYQNMAEILRELAAQVRFSKPRNELVNFADTFDRLAALAEHSSEATSKTSPGSTVETALSFRRNPRLVGPGARQIPSWGRPGAPA